MTFLCEVATQLKQIQDSQFKLAANLIQGIKISGMVFCVGNGGSSGTMSHLASDLNNLGVMSYCLTDNVPRLTALTNDKGWENVYRDMLNGFIKPEDLLIIASVNGSSGKSEDGESWSSNLYDVAELFKERKAKVLSIVGNDGGSLEEISDLCICISSKDPFIVEGIHSVATHGICDALKRSKQID